MTTPSSAAWNNCNTIADGRFADELRELRAEGKGAKVIAAFLKDERVPPIDVSHTSVHTWLLMLDDGADDE